MKKRYKQAVQNTSADNNSAASTFVETSPDAPRPQAIASTEQQSGTASLSGTVIDKDGAALPRAHVTLTGSPGSPVRTVQSGSNGQFEFTGLMPGIYKLTLNAPGMSTFTSSEIPVNEGDFHILQPVTLSVAPMVTTVTVSGNSDQLTEEQLHISEQQRIAGIIPNFYSSYDWNAPPMLAKQKFQLSIRSVVDPVSFLGVAGIAGARTDNDSSFGTQFTWHLADLSISHHHIPPGYSEVNGKVERSHKTDAEEFYRGKSFHDKRDLARKLKH